ncbi:pyridoxamine 5'-phosphate oxidase family protein [uncultured Clostridium sp.]|uniref:pyridoxamine 5'-phosphate oxidase family protein n=1 Tax=uncultured Clostridium sp. TaxID=59620 RepID=UPI00262CE624|nr:pyridoxamine 5'-phosphate oxidase family protein [uncultured Clostridium sp.]
MFKEMRKAKQAISAERIEEILKAGEYGVLSTVGENGYPYGAPVNYSYINGKLYFHGAVKGHKIENIEFNNKVSFTVVGNTKVLAEKFDSEFESVIMFGKAVEVKDKEKEEVLLYIVNKYSSDYVKEGKEYIERAFNAVKVMRVDLDHITGKYYKDK